MHCLNGGDDFYGVEGGGHDEDGGEDIVRK